MPREPKTPEHKEHTFKYGGLNILGFKVYSLIKGYWALWGVGGLAWRDKAKARRPNIGTELWAQKQFFGNLAEMKNVLHVAQTRRI